MENRTKVYILQVETTNNFDDDYSWNLGVYSSKEKIEEAIKEFTKHRGSSYRFKTDEVTVDFMNFGR
jgi:hypothetical protein